MNDERYLRLREAPVFRNDRFAQWARARLLVIGGGALGSRFALEAVRSGVSHVCICDPEPGELHNLATQAVRPGLPKVRGIVSECDAIRPGAAGGIQADVRHVGIGVLRRFDALIDLTDDPRLAYSLTEISNGLGTPRLRAAVDGLGRHEIGRVLCSDARAGGACELCSYSWSDLAAGASRTPCPGAPLADRPPTRAGNALAAVIAGLALLQTQRLVTGNELELVRNREVIVDLSHFQIMGAVLRRSEQCLSGHATWELIEVPAAECTCLDDVYRAARQVASDDRLTLEPYGHPLCLEARCECGAVRLACGTQWAAPPVCDRCTHTMSWRSEMQLAALDHLQAAALGILPLTLAQLGLPDRGAMFVLRLPHRPALRLVLVDEGIAVRQVE